MNPLYRALQRNSGDVVSVDSGGSSGGGGPSVLWSVVYASKGTGDPITINAGESVMFDLAQSPVYGEITNNGTLTVSRALNTELRFKGFMNHGICP